ncbi:hypothetical protein KJ640_07895 [bacterium]|nr:hypothetical protein [bacterium]
MNNPSNPDVRGVKKKEVKHLFPNRTFDFHRITLAPPITRLSWPHTPDRSVTFWKS